MIVEQTVSIDIEDLFNNLSVTEKHEFCTIALNWLTDDEILSELSDRNPDWDSFGLKKEE